MHTKDKKPVVSTNGKLCSAKSNMDVFSRQTPTYEARAGAAILTDPHHYNFYWKKLQKTMRNMSLQKKRFPKNVACLKTKNR